MNFAYNYVICKKVFSANSVVTYVSTISEILVIHTTYLLLAIHCILGFCLDVCVFVCVCVSVCLCVFVYICLLVRLAQFHTGEH